MKVEFEISEEEAELLSEVIEKVIDSDAYPELEDVLKTIKRKLDDLSDS